MTEDGERWFSYAAGRVNSADTTKDKKVRGIGVWFKDGKKMYASRSDSRKVKDLFVIDDLSNPRPEVEIYRYAMPGEQNVPQSHLHIFDIESRNKIDVDIDQYIDQTIRPYLPGKTSDKMFMSRMNRTSDFFRRSIN